MCQDISQLSAHAFLRKANFFFQFSNFKVKQEVSVYSLQKINNFIGIKNTTTSLNLFLRAKKNWGTWENTQNTLTLGSNKLMTNILIDLILSSCTMVLFVYNKSHVFDWYP